MFKNLNCKPLQGYLERSCRAHECLIVDGSLHGPGCQSLASLWMQHQEVATSCPLPLWVHCKNPTHMHGLFFYKITHDNPLTSKSDVHCRTGTASWIAMQTMSLWNWVAKYPKACESQWKWVAKFPMKAWVAKFPMKACESQLGGQIPHEGLACEWHFATLGLCLWEQDKQWHFVTSRLCLWTSPQCKRLAYKLVALCHFKGEGFVCGPLHTWKAYQLVALCHLKAVCQQAVKPCAWASCIVRAIFIYICIFSWIIDDSFTNRCFTSNICPIYVNDMKSYRRDNILALPHGELWSTKLGGWLHFEALLELSLAYICKWHEELQKRQYLGFASWRTLKHKVRRLVALWSSFGAEPCLYM